MRTPTSERGQAVSETLMISWVLIVFIAAAHQLFLVNETVFRSITAAHQSLFRTAFQHNCAEAQENCTYDGGDLRAKVIWDPAMFPELYIRRVGLFAQFGMPSGMRITSNSPLHLFSLTCRDCKRTKLGAGTYLSRWAALGQAFGGLSGGFGFSLGGIVGMFAGDMGLGNLGGDMGLNGLPGLPQSLQNQLDSTQQGLTDTLGVLNANAQTVGRNIR